MITWRLLTCVLLGAIALGGCGSGNNGPTAVVDFPYEGCYAGDICSDSLACVDTNLSLSSGAAQGFYCTSGCTYDSDCLQVAGNDPAICFNSQCYQSCPSGDVACPLDQGCYTFDSTLGPVDLCAP